MSKEKKFNWSNEIVDELIDMIQEREVVWNVQSKQYHNKDNRKDAVIEICDKIGCTEDEFRKKWNTIRTQYTQEKTKSEKSRKSGCGTDDVYIPKWTWFGRLNFLWDVIGPKRSVSNIQQYDDTNSGNIDEDDPVSDKDDNIDQESIEDSECVDLSETDGLSVAKKMKFAPSRGKKSTRDIEMKMLQSATGLLDNLRKSKSTAVKIPSQPREDEFDTFGKYVATELRQIQNPHALRVAKHKISDILFDAQCSTPVPTGQYVNRRFSAPASTEQQHNMGFSNQQIKQAPVTSQQPDMGFSGWTSPVGQRGNISFSGDLSDQNVTSQQDDGYTMQSL